MESPHPLYILSRAAMLAIALVVVVTGYNFIKKKQRQSHVIGQLETLCSDSSFFQQFYPEDARKTLIRAVGLLAEANALGIAPDAAISRGLGIKPKFYGESDTEEPPARQQIIRQCLRSNFDNFLKLGYQADRNTLEAMKSGELPPIPTGPHSGSPPTLVQLIPSRVSPGMEKVIANLQIRPPESDAHVASDIEIAAAKQLARDLAEARLIEAPVRDRILIELSQPAPAPAR